MILFNVKRTLSAKFILIQKLEVKYAKYIYAFSCDFFNINVILRYFQNSRMSKDEIVRDLRGISGSDDGRIRFGSKIYGDTRR